MINTTIFITKHITKSIRIGYISCLLRMSKLTLSIRKTKYVINNKPGDEETCKEEISAKRQL